MPIEFDEILFNPGLIRSKDGSSYPVSATLEYANGQPRNGQTGIRKTNVGRYDGIYMCSVDLGLQDDDDSRYLTSFMRAGQGSAVGFRASLPWDKLAIEEVFGLGDGETQDFKLIITYDRPGGTTHPDVRRIYKPVVQQSREKNNWQMPSWDGQTPRVIAVPLVIYVNGSPLVSGWTVDATTGDVHFNTPPGEDALLAWTGEYDTPMAFEGNSFTQLYDVPNGAQYVWREILGPELGLT